LVLDHELFDDVHLLRDKVGVFLELIKRFVKWLADRVNLERVVRGVL